MITGGNLQLATWMNEGCLIISFWLVLASRTCNTLYHLGKKNREDLYGM